MTQTCEICGGVLEAHGVVPGYQAPSAYTILRCETCNAMVANPKSVNPAVYDAIYSVPGGPPGYDRNFQYARAITRVRDPMRYLTSRQDAFWGVERALEGCPGKRILEVGCGLGYLTYALRQSGYEAIGIDLSQDAVEKAKAAYGDFYIAEPIEEYALRSEARFDAVILVEVIEHLEFPMTVIEKALDLLAPGGSLIVTTPNRSYYGRDAAWTTDLPPVHLWWLSEEAVMTMGKRLGCHTQLVDFAEYNARFPVLYVYKSPTESMFDEAGKLVRREILPIALARRLGILQESYWMASRAAGLFSRRRSARRPTLVAAFRPTFSQARAS